jgi:hypothetical protein
MRKKTFQTSAYILFSNVPWAKAGLTTVFRFEGKNKLTPLFDKSKAKKITFHIVTCQC